MYWRLLHGLMVHVMYCCVCSLHRSLDPFPDSFISSLSLFPLLRYLRCLVVAHRRLGTFIRLFPYREMLLPFTWLHTKIGTSICIHARTPKEEQTNHTATQGMYAYIHKYHAPLLVQSHLEIDIIWRNKILFIYSPFTLTPWGCSTLRGHQETCYRQGSG